MMDKILEDQEGVTIFIIDDDSSVRRSLTRLFSSANYHVECYESGDAFLRRPPYDGVGCIILDVNMPGLDGISLHDQLIGSGFDMPVVYLTGHGDIPMSVTAIKHGARDFLTKPVDDRVLLTTIADALASYRQSIYRRLSAEAIGARLATLTEREREVMRHVISGERNKVIASQLNISEKTVKVHRAHIMDKMGVDSLADLVRLCLEAGIAPVDLSEHA